MNHEHIVLCSRFLLIADRSVNHDSIVPLCALAVSLLAFCVSVVTIFVNIRQKKIDNLLNLHQFLHQNELSEARRAIREGECEISLTDAAVRRVCSSFDLAGTLVRNGAVNQKLFFQYWAGPLIKTLETPLNTIAQTMTGGVQVKEYYKDFWWLFEEAKKYNSAK